MIVPPKSFSEKLRYIFFPKDAKGVGIIDRFILTTKLGMEDAWVARADHPKEKELLDAMAELVTAARTDVPKLVIYRSALPNAASLPGGSVVVNADLMDMLSPVQMKAVLGHELSHHRHRFRDLGVGLGLPGAYIAGHETAGRKLWKRATGFKQKLGLLTLDAAGIGASFGLLPLAYQRHCEFEADKESVAFENSPVDMAAALMTLHENIHAKRYAGQSPLKSDSGWSDLFATHPSIEERVARLKQMEADESTLPSPGISR